MKTLLLFTAIAQLNAAFVPAEVSSSKAPPSTPTVLTSLYRHARSGDYLDRRYGEARGLVERLSKYELPMRCFRCLDLEDDRRDSYADRSEQYDRTPNEKYGQPQSATDERRSQHRPTYGDRYDYKDEDDRRQSGHDRYGNGTPDRDDGRRDRIPMTDDRKYDSDVGGGYDRERDRYPDRAYDRPKVGRDKYGYSDDPYYSREPYGYRDRGSEDDRRRYYGNRQPVYDDGYGGRHYPHGERYDDYNRDRYDGYKDRYDGFEARRRPAYDQEYDGYSDRGNGYSDRANGYGDRGNGYDDRGYGNRGRPHDSFRPWDETYRGSAGFDGDGRGYFFASGRPDASADAGSGWGNYGSSRGGYSEQSGGYPGAARPTASGWRNGNEGRRGSGTWHSTGPHTSGGWRNPSSSSGGGEGGTGSSGQQETASTPPSTSYLYARPDDIATTQRSLADDSSTTRPINRNGTTVG